MDSSRISFCSRCSSFYNYYFNSLNSEVKNGKKLLFIIQVPVPQEFWRNRDKNLVEATEGPAGGFKSVETPS